MVGAGTSWVLGAIAIGFSGSTMADVPKQERSAIDRIIGGKGADMEGPPAKPAAR